MHLLGDYSIDILTKRTRLSEQLIPLFCRQGTNKAGLDAYFLNTINHERATVEKHFFTALTKLSNFKIEHFIQLKGQMIKIQNSGKVFLDETSKAKKLVGTIVSIDQLNASSVNFKEEYMDPNTHNKVERQVFNVEDLLNRFVKKKVLFNKGNELQLFVKMDLFLPKLLIGDAYTLTTRLQLLYDEVLQKHSTGEISLTAKLMQLQKEKITINFSVMLKNKSTSISRDIEHSFGIAHCQNTQPVYHYLAYHSDVNGNKIAI